MLAALLAQSGVEVHFVGIAPDDADAVRRCFQAAVNSQPDLILSTAGVSVGVYDYIRQVIDEQGQLSFWRANMRPGKPIAFGAYQDIPFIGLPGNPVSAFVGFLVFVKPALDRLVGLRGTQRQAARAIIDETLTSDGRETYLRVMVSNDETGRMHARTSGHQGSGNLVALSAADALAIIPAGIKKIESGSELSVWLL
jgi:molybdopterin molybdotransferase